MGFASDCVVGSGVGERDVLGPAAKAREKQCYKQKPPLSGCFPGGSRHSWDHRQGLIHGIPLLREKSSFPCWPTVKPNDSSRNPGWARLLGPWNGTGLLGPRNRSWALCSID